jgi:hypothetical protein
MRIGVIALAVMATGISIPAAAASALSVVVAAGIPVLVGAAAVFIGGRSWG